MKKIFSWIVLIILLICMFFAYEFYKERNFNEFSRGEFKVGSSTFTRDNEIKITDYRSYKIESKDFNDAVFYKTVTVKPNTVYKITAKVKVQDVVKQKDVTSNGGAGISIIDTVESSKVITGTSDFQEVELLFNSKNRTNVNIAFRLGGYDDLVKGTAWFTDFKLEEGNKNTNTNWKMLCLIFDEVKTTVTIDNVLTDVNIKMTIGDIDLMKRNLERFKTAAKELSKGNMTVEYDTKVVGEPITVLTYNATNGYFVDPKDIESILERECKDRNYDHIFIVARMGDKLSGSEVPTYDWIGLRWYGLFGHRFFKHKTS